MADLTFPGSDLLDYVDLPYVGPAVGNTIVSGEKAIQNAVKMFLFSKRGDYGRDVTKGGLLFSLLGKTLTNANQASIEKAVREALAQYDNLTVSSVVAQKDKSNRAWKVTVTFVDTLHKLSTTTSFGLVE